MPDPSALLRDRFGLAEFRPGQREVIDALLAGHSAAAVFPTGGGKSLCYQLTSLCLDGLTLVVSPLIALMKDQIDALESRGIRACRLDSSLSADEYRETMDAIRSGAVSMLYVAPERFHNERFRSTISSLRIALFAVDEAHCISEWGHAFRPDYLKLARFAASYGCERVLALTATATPQVLDDIRAEFSILPEHAVRTGFYRPNLRLRATGVSGATRDQALLERLRDGSPGATIVYVTLQKTAERVAADIAANANRPARAYHAGLGAENRAAVQEWFMATPDAIVVATIAFGMGIDKSDIRSVYHYNLPKSVENYAQEIGRAGRDGEPSLCEVLMCPDDRNVLENFVFGDTPDRDAVAALVSDVLDGDEQLELSIYDCSQRFDIRDLVVRTILTYLELDGWIEGGTPIFSKYRFQPQVASTEILGHFDGEERTFVGSLLGCAKKARTWFSIDLVEAQQQLDAPRGRIVQVLDQLGERGWLKLESTGVRQRYRRLRSCDDTATLADTLYARCLEREQRELDRLQQVFDLLASPSCQTAALCEHFGEPRDGCGHCGACEHGPLDLPPPGAQPEIDADAWQAFEALRVAEPDALGTPRAVARFACGISSPAFRRAKLSRHALFGSLQHVRFTAVLEHAAAD